jgi:Tfp pilus assembly protein PilN
MKLHLNLTTAPQPNKRPFFAGAAAAGTVGVVALLVLSVVAYKSWQASRELHSDISSLQDTIRHDQQRQEQLQAYFQGSEAKQILDRSAFLNSLIDERSFPWTKIFMDLEDTLPPGVRVVSIAPRLVDSRAEVTLEVGAMTEESKIQFLQAIEKSKAFSGMVVKDERRPVRPQPGVEPDQAVLQLTVWYSTT